jgi:hypothetical protein
MIGQVKEFRIGEEIIHMQWRGWLGLKPTEAEFVRGGSAADPVG